MRGLFFKQETFPLSATGERRHEKHDNLSLSYSGGMESKKKQKNPHPHTQIVSLHSGMAAVPHYRIVLARSGTVLAFIIKWHASAFQTLL